MAERDVYEKASDRHFELFKHLTTLNTAASLVVLAVYRGLPVGIIGSFWPLLNFSLSLVACLWGMLSLALGGDIRTLRDARFYMALVVFGTLTFILGLFVAGIGFLIP